MSDPKKRYPIIEIRRKKLASGQHPVVVMGYELLIDGQVIPGVQAVKFSLEAGKIAKCQIDLVPSEIRCGPLKTAVAAAHRKLTKREAKKGLAETTTIGTDGWAEHVCLDKEIA